MSRTEYNLQCVHGSRGTSSANSVTGIRGRTVKVHYTPFVESEFRAVRVAALMFFELLSFMTVVDGE